ncbi:hypothetical protein L9F63_020067, partial [Diploptera punctata]
LIILFSSSVYFLFVFFSYFLFETSGNSDIIDLRDFLVGQGLRKTLVLKHYKAVTYVFEHPGLKLVSNQVMFNYFKT